MVDYELFEKALPLSFRQAGATRRTTGRNKATTAKGPRNLDWIIDAVARGDPVEVATPHNRREPKVHVCEYCGLRLKYPSKIKAHMRTHTNERPFVCDICGISFAMNTTLRMHLRRHLNQKLFACPYNDCGHSFINGGLLNAHIQSRHKGQTRRYACLRGCGRVFRSNPERERHEQTDCDFLQENEYVMEGAFGQDYETKVQVLSYHQMQQQWSTEQTYAPEAEDYEECEADADVVVDDEAVYQPVTENYQDHSAMYGSNVAQRYPCVTDQR